MNRVMREGVSSSRRGSGQWLDPTEVRGLRTALNELSDANKQLIENVQRLLIAHIDRDDVSPLELWGYSEGTIVLGARHA